MINFIRVFALVEHDEEAEGESNDQEHVVAQALHQVKCDRVEHEADAATEDRVPGQRKYIYSASALTLYLLAQLRCQKMYQDNKPSQCSFIRSCSQEIWTCLPMRKISSR